MQSETLYFKSGIKCYGIQSDEEPHSAQVGGLTISEKYWPRSSSERGMPPGIQNYELVIEADVATREEGRKAWAEAFDLANELDKGWVYTCGEPLHPALTTLHFLDAPEGWQTNAKEVDVSLAKLESQPYSLSGEIRHRHYRCFLSKRLLT